MNTKSSILKKVLLYILMPLVIIAMVVMKLKNNQEITKGKIYQYDKEQAIHVQTDTLHFVRANANYSYSGTFEPNKETKISAEVQGKINSVLVDVGSVVSKEQSLIQIDNALLKLQLQTVEVQIEGLEADVNRYGILAKADAIQGVQLEKSILGLKSAKIQRATLIEQINKTIIKAPFGGIVTAKLSEEGAFAALGMPLLQVTDITNLKFTIHVSENDLHFFKLGQSYTISIDVLPHHKLPGKITMVGSKSNIGSSFAIQFLVQNIANNSIKAGMFGKVVLNENADEMGIVIPASIVVGTAEQPHVYVVKNSKAILTKITVSKHIENKLVVSSGLNENDVIIINGFINLFDGATIATK